MALQQCLFSYQCHIRIVAKGEILSFRAKQTSQVHKLARAATKTMSNLGMVVVDIPEGFGG